MQKDEDIFVRYGDEEAAFYEKMRLQDIEQKKKEKEQREKEKKHHGLNFREGRPTFKNDKKKQEDAQPKEETMESTALKNSEKQLRDDINIMKQMSEE